jgi:predicted oxidoreductase (fatty acid repression mutant protein)
MTTKEQKTIDQLFELISKLNEKNEQFRISIQTQLNSGLTTIDKVQQPVELERDILRTAQTAIDSAIKSVLTGYNSPLTKLIERVVNDHSNELYGIISDSFSAVIKTDTFKQSIVSAFSHKVARSIISNNDGLFDKVSNELKQDAKFKAKMALAVASVVEECLRNSNEV